MAEACCPICTEAMTAEGGRHVLPCGHAFHTDCVVEWFRHGASTCPVCRDGTRRLTGADRETRSKMLQRRARRKDAPRELRALKDRLQRAKEAQKEAKLRRREFLEAHRETLRGYSRLQAREWATGRRVDGIEREFGLFTHPDFPIPLLTRRRA